MRPVVTYVLLLLVASLSFVSCKKDDPKSTLAGITAFSLKDRTVAFTIDETLRVIQNEDSLPFQTDVSALVAIFQTVPLSVAKVGGTAQVSGTTPNNFNTPVTYDVVAEDGITTRSYTVKVNVAKLDPNTVAWQRLTDNAGWGPFRTASAGAFGGKLWLFGAQSGSFGAFTRGVYNSADGITWTAIAAAKDNMDNPIPFAERQTAVFGFKNKVWLLGGLIPAIGMNFSKVTNEVWSSTDGTNWTVKTPATGETWWSIRERINAVVFKDKLFIVGGNKYPSFGNANTPGAAMNDVWSSTDGTAWTEVTPAAAFLPRTNPAVFVHKDKIYVAGGRDNGGNLLNDVWTSADGATWTQLTTSAAFTARWGHKVIVYKDQLFLLGGETSATETSAELWVSQNDGVNWTKAEGGDPRVFPASFTARTHFSFFNDNNTIWVIGGQGPKNGSTFTFVNDVWKGAFPQ